MNFDFGSFHHESVFTNEATGIFRVISRDGTNPAFGLAGGHYGSGWNGDLVNAGLFEVTAAGYAAGVFTYDMTFSLMNSGVLRVTSASDFAIGAWAANGGTYANTGQIAVQGVNAYGLVLEKAGTITNGGEIRVTATGPAPAIGVVVRSLESETIQIHNTGLIEADIAILDQSFLYSPVQNARQEVFNSGVIRGLIDLRHGDDELINAGRIEGRVDLGAGADVYDGTNGSTTDIVSGGAGADHLTGGAQTDVLVGGDGDDVLAGGGGDDILAGGRGGDRLDGGAGVDTAVFSDLSLGVELDLQAGTMVGTAAGTITGVENAVGSAWADRLRGDAGANSLFGGDGDDTLEGRDGDDVLSGERGDDILTGGGGADTFVFAPGGGNDVITDFVPGVDRLQVHGYGGWREVRQDGADVLLILSDTDSIRLKGLTVAALGSGGQDFLATPPPRIDAPNLGGTVTRSETLRFELDEAIVAGETLVFRDVGVALAIVGFENGRVRLVNEGAIDLAGSSETGGLSGVTISGPSSGTFVNGSSGRVAVQASGSSVTAFGVVNMGIDGRVENLGVIEVTGDGDAAGITHNGYSLSLAMNAGIIRVDAGAHARGISAGQWATVGNSGLIEVTGAASATGILTTTNTPVVVNSGTIRVVSAQGPAVGIDGAFGRLMVDNSGVIDAAIAIRANIWDDRVDNTGSIFGTVSLGAGDDTVVNHGRMTGLVSLGDGADVYDGALSSHGAAVNGEAGDDRLSGGRGADSLSGGAGADIISGGGGGDTLNGGDGDDKLYGGDGNDILYGGAGADILEGGAGDDILIANGGNDIIRGGTGTDTVHVPGGSEQYRLLADGDDFILKGLDGADRISGVEFIRFSSGEIWDLARMYRDGPDVLPEAPSSKGGLDQPLVLPGSGEGPDTVTDPSQAVEPPLRPGLLLRLGPAGQDFDPNGDWSLTVTPHPDWG